jgi:hypothetical protein
MLALYIELLARILALTGSDAQGATVAVQGKLVPRNGAVSPARTFEGRHVLTGQEHVEEKKT